VEQISSLYMVGQAKHTGNFVPYIYPLYIPILVCFTPSKTSHSYTSSLIQSKLCFLHKSAIISSSCRLKTYKNIILFMKLICILKKVVRMKRLQYYNKVTWFIMFIISVHGTASWYQRHYILNSVLTMPYTFASQMWNSMQGNWMNHVTLL